jgi:hypothetical protein
MSSYWLDDVIKPVYDVIKPVHDVINPVHDVTVPLRERLRDVMVPVRVSSGSG